MPRLIFSDGAVDDLKRLRGFLLGKNPVAAQRASSVIRERLWRLVDAPEAGRPVEASTAFRELVIPFGEGGYLARYRYIADQDIVVILAIRHQREVGY